VCRNAGASDAGAGNRQAAALRDDSEAGEWDAETLYARYEHRSQSPVARSTRRKYLGRLVEYELVDIEGSGRGKRYLQPEAAD
jgi:hypothetical protein